MKEQGYRNTAGQVVTFEEASSRCANGVDAIDAMIDFLHGTISASELEQVRPLIRTALRQVKADLEFLEPEWKAVVI